MRTACAIALPGWVLALATWAPAAILLDFERASVGALSDGQAISDQFLKSHGMSFALEDGSWPLIALAGGQRTAFNGYRGRNDRPAPGSNVGSVFLTDDGIVGHPPLPMIVTYDRPVGAAGGVIVDIDVGEAWRVTALDSAGLELGVVHLGEVTNATASAWSFSFTDNLIGQVRLDYVGAKDRKVGVAFDNFWHNSAAAVPEPATVTLVLGAAGLAVLRRRGHNVARASRPCRTTWRHHP